MTQNKAAKQNLETLRENEKKWSKPLMDAGWSAIPSILLEKQAALGLNAMEMNILLHLVQYWWYETNLPHPSVKTIANALGVKERTVQRHIAQLCELGFLERQERRHTPKGSDTNLYSFNGLIEKLTPYAQEKIAERKKRAADDKARVNRKRPALHIVQ
jgi:DNA-binding MarR family transcriptional regulator